jgi:xylulokinase
MFLGIDIGTSGVKTVLLSESGALVEQSSVALTVRRPHPLWSEQKPEDWWDAAGRAVRALAPGLRKSVRAIGLAGQMHGATLLDREAKPLRDAILWNDGRSAEQARRMHELVPDMRAITGNEAMPGLTAPKLLWVKEHEPEIFDRISKVLLPKDYVRLRMTGDFASDASDSSGTLWLDGQKRVWSERMLAACGLKEDQMPRVHEGVQVTGTLRRSVADRWGMDIVPVVAGAGDNAAGAFGCGVVNSGDAMLSLGTSGVIFAACDSFGPGPAGGIHCFAHCVPARWSLMSVHLAAASCVEWGCAALKIDNVREFFELAEGVEASVGDELFFPYLSGERTPFNDPTLKGSLHNIGHDTDRARIARAILEGVAFAFADGIEAMAEAGVRPERLRVVGGGARSLQWGQIIADTLNVTLDFPEHGEVGPALGAARLAVFATQEDAAQQLRILNRIHPDPTGSEYLREKRRAFQKIQRLIVNKEIRP